MRRGRRFNDPFDPYGSPSVLTHRKVQSTDRILHPEAYHPEASKFCLYVGNYAGVCYLTNQKHGIIFCPNMESVDWRKIMAVPFRSAARKLIRTKIRAISLAGKCCWRRTSTERLGQLFRLFWGSLGGWSGHACIESFIFVKRCKDFLGEYFRASEPYAQ